MEDRRWRIEDGGWKICRGSKLEIEDRALKMPPRMPIQDFHRRVIESHFLLESSTVQCRSSILDLLSSILNPPSSIFPPRLATFSRRFATKIQHRRMKME
jgi:hypothetical protein